MADITLNCSKCGAPVPYDGSDVKTIQCPFCNSTIIIPPELRPHKVVPPVQVHKEPVLPERDNTPTGVAIRTIFISVSVFVLLLIGTLVALFTFKGASEQPQVDIIIPTETEYIPPTDTPEPSPTPAYEAVKFSFGQKGINPGQFNNTRYIAISPDNWIVTADYDSGRIQVFDMQGKYLRQWKTADDQATIQGLAAGRDRMVYVSTAGSIFVYDGETGDQVREMKSAKGGEYGDLAMTPDGNLAAVWYEGRWGIITSLEGHSEALDVYNSKGKVIQSIASPISGQTRDLALDVMTAVDGRGTYYLMDGSTIYVYSADGKFQNKFAVYGSNGNQMSVSSNLIVDGQGMLYAADNSQVTLFDANGHVQKSFPTDSYVNFMALDSEENLWTVSDSGVDEYVKTGF